MESTTCCVVGGGPAGMVLALLLARAGVEVTVLEKHSDFLRDFRGDTVHPSTLTLLDELGLGEQFAKLPHRKLERVQLPVNGGLAQIVDFSKVPGKHKYVAMVPQWDFLDLLAEAARAEATFSLRMNTEVTGLLRKGGGVVGVRYRTARGEIGELRADLTVACDGRYSAVRSAADLPSHSFGVPMDVWWYRLPRHDGDPEGLGGRFNRGRAAVFIDRGDYFQAGYLILKGADTQLRTEGIAAFRQRIAELLPWLADRVEAIQSWDDVKLLEVQLDRLPRWYTQGLLCIGDAAHAMSPIGGVGINLAVQDAVAAARYLAGPLFHREVRTRDLAHVQLRRWLPTTITQTLQRIMHAVLVRRALASKISVGDSDRLPLPLRLMQRFPWLQGIPARLLGIGVLPEHAPDFARRF